MYYLKTESSFDSAHFLKGMPENAGIFMVIAGELLLK